MKSVQLCSIPHRAARIWVVISLNWEKNKLRLPTRTSSVLCIQFFLYHLLSSSSSWIEFRRREKIVNDETRIESFAPCESSAVNKIARRRRRRRRRRREKEMKQIGNIKLHLSEVTSHTLPFQWEINIKLKAMIYQILKIEKRCNVINPSNVNKNTQKSFHRWCMP